MTPTGPGTFTYTGTRTFVAANGDEVFSAITGRGTFTRTTAHTTETDTITGGTGRLAGASGTHRDTASFVVGSVTGPVETSRFTAAVQGQIRYWAGSPGRASASPCRPRSRCGDPNLPDRARIGRVRFRPGRSPPPMRRRARASSGLCEARPGGAGRNGAGHD